MEPLLIAFFIFDIIALGVAIWWLWTRVRSKLDDVEKRHQRRWEREYD
ncbi:MAG: Uncharacterised protein [Methanobacteriota archaeon]|nr:MAG: Uncharacterised protein [Euryarchaeota archaeon]